MNKIAWSEDNIWNDPDERLMDKISLISNRLNLEVTDVLNTLKASFQIYLNEIEDSFEGESNDFRL